MKKHLFLKSLLVAIGLLVTSLTTQTWADCAYHVTGGNIYLDAGTPGWNLGYVHMGHGHDGSFQVNHFSESKITGTQLYYLGSITGTWSSNVCYLMFWNASTSWPSARNYDDVKKYAPKYSGKSTYSFDSGSTYLVVPSATNDEMATISYLSSGYTDLNNSQTVKKYTCVNGTSYSEASVNSGTVTIQPYKMTGQGTASNASNTGTINTAGATSVSKDAAYTGEVRLNASANSGYVFMGWFDAENGGDAVETGSTYTYNAPNSTKTVYARFAPKFQEGKRLYLNLDSFTSWKSDGARFAVCFGNATTQQWANCTLLTGNTYYVDVPSGSWGYAIFCRMKGNSATNNWDNRDNQAPDLMAYGTYNCVKITDWGSGSWCRYSQNPVIIRSHNDWNPEGADAMSISDNICTKSLNFNAHSTYQVKILDGINEYGLNEMVVTSSISNYSLNSGQYQLRVATAGAGDYTFTYNKSNNQLSIEYPDVNHPSTDYCYVIKYSWSTPKLHIWGSSSGAAATSSVTAGPTLYNYENINGADYYYIAPGDYTDFLVSDNGHATDRTRDVKSDDGYGKYRWADGETWKWSNWSFTVTLDEQHVVTSAPADPTVEFNGATLTGTLKPTWTGYTFGGYWNTPECNKVKVIDENGAWIASVAGYTDGSKWIHEGGTATLYAKWTADPLVLTTAGNWSTASNWTPACVPTKDHEVTIQKNVTVDIPNAQAKSVVIDQSSTNTGKLTVGAGKALVVATTIQKKTGSGTGATEETDIVLESDGTNGTGALVTGTASDNTKATVQFYTKAKKDGSGKYINQYFGVPVESTSKLAYYGAYLRKYDQATDAWVSFTEESNMVAWQAYRIMREETTNDVFEIGGTLLLPGTSGTKELTLYNNESHSHDNMFVNSWTAPIDIRKLVGAFTGAVATIYIFNAGTSAEYSGTPVQKGASAGNWNSLPVAATMNVPEDYDLNVIPSQQAFLVQANGAEGTHKLTLDYGTAVYNPLKNGESSIIATRAPKRTAEEDLEIVRLYMEGESGLGDRVLMYVRDDFSAEELDNGWEAYKLPGSAFAPQLCAYSPLGEMSINATNEVEGTVLGFYAGTGDSQYKFTFDYEGENAWYLNDLDTEKSTLISNTSAYEFSATPGTAAEKRFIISANPIQKITTGTDEVVDGSKARKQMIGGQLYIIRDGRIYNAEGSLVK